MSEIRIGWAEGMTLGAGHDPGSKEGRRESSAHLLHLGENVLVRGQLAIKTEELLLLLSQRLSNEIRRWLVRLHG